MIRVYSMQHMKNPLAYVATDFEANSTSKFTTTIDNALTTMTLPASRQWKEPSHKYALLRCKLVVEYPPDQYPELYI